MAAGNTGRTKAARFAPAAQSALRAKADELEAFMNEHTEQLDFENYDSLRETEATLRALAEFLEHVDPQGFVAAKIAAADHELRFFSEYLGLNSDNTGEKGGAP
jgi:hypothetical protein